MVGHLHLQAMDDSLKGKNREGLLDSPDSGLPPSPSPPFYSLSPALLETRSASCTTPTEHHGYYKKESKEGKLLPYLLLNSTGSDTKARMYPVFFGRASRWTPNQSKRSGAIRSETVVAVHNCTWRSYKSELQFEPRQRPLYFQSTTIIFPKRAKNTYRTTLHYNASGSHRWFVSSVQLESSEDASPCIIYTEDL
ncbi:hypothetical protein AAFF_G00023410 [Aldrovandia affinis]|uniref:Refilin A n=1 Tax=Aldrovandia affinis TaxID=143900 RepID=A0AAD7T5X3_9TELE|nr:hypothetical protein AAFF_G00023410 [Aldrovandia affinis]